MPSGLRHVGESVVQIVADAGERRGFVIGKSAAHMLVVQVISKATSVEEIKRLSQLATDIANLTFKEEN